VPMGAVALDLGQPDGAQFLVHGSALQHILRKLSKQKSRQKLLEGPRPGSTKSPPRRGRAVEARKYNVAEVVPHNSFVAKLAFQKEPKLCVVNAGTTLGGCRARRLKAGLVETELGCWIMRPRAD
jgi:hypothetical protein